MCGEMRNAYIMLVGKSKAKRPVGRPACSWKDTKMDGKRAWIGFR
jgi:hypothetical protein